ncbi:uncharacterized protein N7482_004239 [Penicillium canariense]|uniref:Xylanolytic transcriptional activator regulatory domain-containing protein n=1 Tax=Penicillium canariense TaxID=189055 RepID=A0A9W9I685_9EURO|nr:uncharacterized protein N7482_004239 [Penicillium canariense]KAJ5168645.1 hypothetical protein N7482_004239 [Penicillium canariense]
MGWSWPEIKEKLQCPKDEDAQYENTTWCNRDLIPIPPDRRTYGVLSYFGNKMLVSDRRSDPLIHFLGYWTVSGSCISAWSTGSTLLAFGLSPQQAIAVVVVGGVLAGLLAVAFPVVLRVFVACMWFGMQAFWGGQATSVMIGAIIPGFAHMPNYFAAGSHLQTKDFIGLVIWMCAFIPGLLIRPEKLQIPFVICFTFFCGSCFGILIWAVSQAHGPGKMFHEPATAPNVGWAFMFGITAILGSWGSGTLGQSDWTRYAKRRFAPTLSQLVASPLTIGATATIGIVVTSAARDVMGGEIEWNPIYLLAEIQEYYHSSPGVRAGVFFASIGMVFSQFSISVVLNSVSCGMDMAGLWPRYINIRRGAYIMACIGIATQPWQLLSTAEKFLSVLSGFGVFMAPATGILLADYHIVRHYKLRLGDLYTGDSSSIYWFSNGVNWRAFVAFLAGMWPLLLGLALSFSVFWALSRCFPPTGLGLESSFTGEEVIYGVPKSDVDNENETQLQPDATAGSSRQGQQSARNLSSTADGTSSSSLNLGATSSPANSSSSWARPLSGELLSPLNHSTEAERWLTQGTSPTAPSAGPLGSTDEEPLLLYTLEDNKNRTAHSMGLCAEQDTDLLASFRSVIMNETDGVSADVIQISAGNPAYKIPPVHFNVLHDEFQPADDVAKTRASENIEAMVSPHGPILVRLFFKHVHPVYCVVSKARFLQAYATEKLQIPASLRGAIYGLGSMFWQQHPDAPRPLQFDLHDLFEEAHSSLQREFHAPNLWKLQACLLLLYERPADNATIETPRTWIFSSHAVACAQMIGLHRDPGSWQICPWEKKVRKKLWWATYMADIWSSVCHGNPPLIYPASFTTSKPSIEDLAFDEDIPKELAHMVDDSSTSVDISTTARFLQMVELSQILHDLIDSYYLDAGYEKSMADPADRESRLLEVKKRLENWAAMAPQCVTMRCAEESLAFRNNAPLQLAFFATQALLFRALMSPAKPTSKNDPDSSLRRYFAQAVGEFQRFTLFMDEITLACLHSFWGGRKSLLVMI